MSVKSERIASSFVREISLIIMEEIHDESIKKVTITHATVTNDLSYAKVYFTSLEDNKEELVKKLNNASSFIRSLLAQRVDIRHTPELEFIYDDSILYGAKIESIINQLNEK